MKVFELESGRQVHTFYGHAGPVTVLAVDASEDWLYYPTGLTNDLVCFTGAEDLNVRAYSMHTGHCLHEYSSEVALEQSALTSIGGESAPVESNGTGTGSKRGSAGGSVGGNAGRRGRDVSSLSSFTGVNALACTPIYLCALLASRTHEAHPRGNLLCIWGRSTAQLLHSVLLVCSNTSFILTLINTKNPLCQNYY